MTLIALAVAAVLIIGVTAAFCYLAGREHGHNLGYDDGLHYGYKQGFSEGEYAATHREVAR